MNINANLRNAAQRFVVRRAGTTVNCGTAPPARPHLLKFGGMADEVETSCCAQPRARTNGQIILSILDKYQSDNWGESASFVSALCTGWNEKTVTLPVGNYLTMKINLKDAFKNQPDMIFLAPMGFDKLRDKLQEADLLAVRAICLESRRRMMRRRKQQAIAQLTGQSRFQRAGRAFLRRIARPHLAIAQACSYRPA